MRPAVPAPGEAKSDLWIFQALATEMGAKLGGASAQAVKEEIRTLVPLYGGISYARLDSPATPAGLQWPCPSTDHPGTPFLYSDGFPDGKGKLLPAGYEEIGGEAEPAFTLITGPTKFHSGSLSARSPGLARLQGETVVQVHPADARALGLAKDQRVHLESGNGKISAKVSLSTQTAPGVLFIPCHIRGERRKSADRVGFAADPGETRKGVVHLFFTAEDAEGAEAIHKECQRPRER